MIALLYENLAETDTRIKIDAAVVDIEVHENGVKVYLKDGSIKEGSIVVGVDGIYSKTRQIMQRLAQTPPDTWPMTAAYQGLYGDFHSCPGLNQGTFYQSRGSGIVSQAMSGEDKGHFAILRAISPTADPKRYTTEHRDSLADEFSNTVVAPGIRFKAIWERTVKETAAMVNQEEGSCDKWYHGRIALAGDAVHKVTSVTGMGVNVSINSAAALANELYRTLQSEPDPSTGAVEDAFFRYQQIRDPEASQLHTIGRMQIRGVTWATWADWFFDLLRRSLGRYRQIGGPHRGAYQKGVDAGIRAVRGPEGSGALSSHPCFTRMIYLNASGIWRNDTIVYGWSALQLLRVPRAALKERIAWRDNLY